MNLIDSLHGVLPTKRWGNFNFEKLKSLGGRVFSFIRGEGQVHIWGTVIIITKGRDNSGQTIIIYYTITSFSQKTFMVTFKEKIVFIFTSLVLKGHV